MKKRSILVFLVLITTLFSNQIFSQTKVFALDSLAGFDEKQAYREAYAEGLFGEALKGYISGQKRTYIAVKYDLLEKVDYSNGRDPIFNVPFARLIGGGGAINALPCVNEDFELSSLSNWTVTRGQNTSSNVYPTFTTTIASGAQVSVVSTPIIDPFVGSIPASPLGGTSVARINNTVTGTAAAIRLQQTFPVTASNYLYEFAYWAVMENAVPAHNCSQTPYMTVRLRNSAGTLQACPNFSIVAPSTPGGCAGIGPTTWTLITSGGRTLQVNNSWQRFSIDLSSFIPLVPPFNNVTIDVVVAHCSPTGHFGYAYFDSNCNTMNLTVNGQGFNMPTNTVSAVGLCGNTATMVAPGGLGPYSWTGPPGTFTNNTSQTVTTNIAGNYTLNMSPSGICNPPITRIITLSFAPPTTITASSNTVCSGSPVTFTASGATQYTWTPGGINTTTYAVTPLTTSVYSLTARTGTCIGNYTRQITVNPLPTIVPSSSPSGSVCGGNSSTLTATGGLTYTWLPMNTTGSTAVVAPLVNTSYTAVGTDSNGCIGSGSLNLGVSATPTLLAFNFTNPTSSVCAGTPVLLVASGGAASVTWTPGGSNLFSPVLTPSVTTNYTLNGASGACTGSTTITVSVDPGPSITVSSNPAISCPYIIGTLTAIAPSATGFTWTPPGTIYTGTSSTHTVNPATTTNYSVQGINAAGCRSTFTINQVVNPAPSPTIAASASSICLGTSVTYTATGGSSYTWNPGGTTGSLVTLSPTASTNYTIISSNGTCTNSTTQSITVVSNPTIGASVSPTAICVGASAALTATGGTSYTWTPGPSSANPFNVSPIINTTYTVVGSVAGCTSNAVVSLVVNALPNLTVTATPTAICPGGLSNIASSGAASYTVNPGSLVGSNVTVSPSSTQIYTVTGLSALGCTNTRTVQVTVNTPPTVGASASPASSVCLGRTVSLSGSGAATYSWIPNNQSGSPVTVTPAISTNYTVIGTSAAGCTATATQSITVVSNPTIGASASPTAICVGASAALTATGGVSYTWTPGPSSANPFNVSPITNTTYTVVGSVAGCTSNAVVSLVVNALPNLTVTATPTAICPGGLSNIASSGAASYTVNPGSLVGSNVTVSPASTQIYTVTGLSALGCTNTRTVQLVVNPTPIVGASASPAASVCLGGNVNLTGSGAATYSWIPNNQSGSPVTVTPAVSTNYTVIGTSALGCTATATQSITVVSIPTIGATASPTAICVGASAALTATGGVSYTWTPGPSSANPFNVSPITNTTYTVVGSVAGCTSNAVVSVVVNALPNLTVTASPTAICPGGVSNIISTGATNYTVMPGSLVGSNVTVSPVSTQIYTVTGVNASGCINTRTVQLVVNPTTSITATATSPSVCSGNSVTLSANGATTYTWNPGNLNGSSVSVSPGVATNYSVTGTNSLGCVTSQATVQVNVITTPTVSASANPTSICLGGISTLTATGAQFYTWLPGGASNSLVTVGPLVSTVYTVTGFATGGVCFDTETVSLVVNALPNLTVTASPTAICPGGLSTINSSGALSYTVNPIGLTGANVTVSPLSTTIYTVTGLSAIGCTNTRTVQLVVNPTTSITATAASPSICSGSSVTLSANGATTYTWNPGNLNGSSVSVSPGVATNYSVTGTNSLGCVTSQATVQVNVITTPTVTASANPTSICLGGVATLTATGAQVGLYTWLPGGATGGSVFIVSPLVSTIYTVIGFDAGGVCSDTETLSLVVNSLPSLSVTASPTAICPGGLSTINSTGALSYTVNPIGLTGANVTVSPVSTTIYTVTGLGAFGCTNTGTVQLLVNSVPLVGATTPSSSICLGASAVLTGTGATSYTWVPIGTVANTVAVSPTVTTTYTVIGANASGCINQNIITITVNPIPSLSVTSVPVSLCPGSSATLTASGATSYSWNTGATGAVTTVTNAGAYIVTGTLGSCSASSTITILPLPGATLVATASPTAICPLGVAICSVTGAATYTWSTGSNANNISVSPTVTTTYSVIGTNGFGCTNTTAVTVIANPSPTLIPSPSSASLCASSSATINVAGPATSYTCLPAPAFSSGNNFTLSPSITTIYTISGTSPLGCVGQTFVTITVAPVPTIVPAASTPSICDGSSLTLSATGANSYTWLPVNLTGSLVTVSPTITTNYTVIGASTVGCTSNSFVTVTVVNVPTLTANASPASICPGASSTMSVTGASSYTWMPGLLTGSSVLVSPLSTTVYSITGANSSGCSSIRTLTLTVNPVPSVSVSPINSTICAGSNILLTGSGASVYSWTPGSLVSPTISANPTVTTTYTVTGANAFGCLGQATAIVSVQPLPVVSITPSATLICPGGSATLTASGGNFYSWNTGSTNTTIIVSPSVTTNYSVLGFVNACSSTVAVVTVSLNSAPSLSITGLIGGSATVCAGNSASLTASGAANYTWNPGGLTTNAVVLTPTLNTFYTLTGASAFGCTSTAIFTIIVSPLPSLTASATSPTVCAGSTTSLIAGGASSYTWNPGNIVGNVVTVTPTVNTIYTLSANSAFGCNSQTTVPVNVQALPVITATASPAAICIGGSATLTAVGASSFIWSNSVALATIIVNPTTTTVYSVAGGSGVCLSNTVVLTITVNPLPTLSVAATSTALCPGGTATLTASGAVAYTWNPGALNTNSIVVTPLASTIYTLNGTSADGCSNSITSNIVVNPNPTVVITSTGIPICAGACATLAATGANSYTWMPGSLTGSSAVVCPTVTTDYTVTGNSLGCIGLNSQNVTVNSLPVITTTATPASICNGFSSTLTASGANTYSWTTIPASGSLVIVSPTINTTYLVSGTNAAGCVSSQSVGVTVNSVPSITITSTSNTICLGATATLTGAGTLSYTWNPSGANTSTLVVNPTATTVYTLIGSNGFGCTTIQFFTLNVVPIPTVNASASSLTVCEGFTTNLIATGANSYTWQPGALNGSLVVVSPTITTNYTVSGDISGCSSTSTVSIFVNPLPTITANASPSIICNGATSTLTAFGALSYTWIPGLVTGSNISVNPTSTSIYTVVGLSALNCPNFAAITLTVLPTPTVFASSSSTAICIGNSATLSANGATTYTWNPGSLTNTIIVVNPTSTTVYSLTGSNGGCSTSNTISITVNNLPIVSANSSTNITCFGSLVTFTATGANAYSWLPIATVGATTSANPTITTIYTVTGTDLNGCNNSTTLNVSVNPLPSLSITAVPLSTICFGGSATINVSGANTYTWNVINLNTNSVVVSPTVNSTYTVNGTDINGCIGNQTISLNVVPIPTINVSPSNPSICAGFNTTLTANGAANYTWLPSNTNGSFAVFNPTTTTTYTVIGDNGGNCPATVTVSLFVNPLPANVTALCSGTITCSNQTVSIIGASSNTNVSYNWVGPGTFTSSLASTSVNVWGNYTLSVTDNITSCTTTLVLNVPTDNSIPSVTASASGSITCAIPTVTLIAANTTSNAGYLWTGPSTFSSILQSFTTNAPGVYTVVVTDLTSGCNSTKTVAVISRTYVPITATISPATCSLGISNNDGKITLSNFTILDKFDFVQGATYTGTATYSNAVLIPSTGIITSNLSNPANTVSYTIRYFDAFGCTKDTTLRLIPVDCVPKVLGLAKAVTSSSLNADGTYNVNYKLTIKNTDSAPLKDILITENLVNTFPAPTTFTVVNAPVITSAGSSLSLNGSFDGINQTNITSTLSVLGVGKTDTIVFTVKVRANGKFGPFNNRIVGTALTNLSVAIRDTSTNGLNPDPDGDLNPTNNSLVTPVSFSPNVGFGLSKVGSFNKLDNNTYDVYYSITVHNLGNDTLRNIVVKDSLFGAVIKAPAKYTIRNGPATTNNLTPNTLFDGRFNINLLVSSASKLAPASEGIINFTINVRADSLNGSTLRNIAFGNALAVINNSNTIVSDTSNSGTNPDVNQNSICNEFLDNAPTIFILPATASPTLFVPQGFSPNGDGINDLFVINGLSNTSENSITVFNRWGNRVYYHGNYNNTWDGYPNIAGTLGKDKLPQGTYYYIIEFKGSGQKPITGFIVLEY